MKTTNLQTKGYSSRPHKSFQFKCSLLKNHILLYIKFCSLVWKILPTGNTHKTQKIKTKTVGRRNKGKHLKCSRETPRINSDHKVSRILQYPQTVRSNPIKRKLQMWSHYQRLKREKKVHSFRISQRSKVLINTVIYYTWHITQLSQIGSLWRAGTKLFI